MAKPNEVLAYLRPNGGYVQVGETYEGISFEPQCEIFSKEEYEAAFLLVDEAKKKAEIDKAKAKKIAETKLAALGLTIEDLKAIGLA